MLQKPELRPPCIVLGLETQVGLGLVRELGRAGVPVVGIACEPGAIGLSSRYLARKLVVSQPRSAELIAAIVALGDELGPCCLMAVSEANLGWLAQHQGEFGRVRPIGPSPDALAMVLDKQRTLQAAREVGVLVPETAEPRSMAEAEALAARLRFPAVLKWKDPNAVAGKLSQAGLALHKAEYVYTPAEFLAAAARYQPIAEWPMVQAYCPGTGLGQFFYMHQGQALRRFQHLRIAEWPPEGGFSSVCDAIPLDQHVALQEQSIALLRHIDWEGVAMVEYRWDAATDLAVLMEINGRYWGSYPLAVQCDVGFSVLSYAVWSAPNSSAWCVSACNPKKLRTALSPCAPWPNYGALRGTFSGPVWVITCGMPATQSRFMPTSKT
jgi:predicted ATP-grasp superfamily ATP-dependent carboligase